MYLSISKKTVPAQFPQQEVASAGMKYLYTTPMLADLSYTGLGCDTHIQGVLHLIM